jgi:hypothetical protein
MVVVSVTAAVLLGEWIPFPLDWVLGLVNCAVGALLIWELWRP